MKFCERKNLIDRQSFVAQYVSLAVLSIGTFGTSRLQWRRGQCADDYFSNGLLGITTLLGSDDLLAAFACGTAFAWE